MLQKALRSCCKNLILHHYSFGIFYLIVKWTIITTLKIKWRFLKIWVFWLYLLEYFWKFNNMYKTIFSTNNNVCLFNFLIWVFSFANQTNTNVTFYFRKVNFFKKCKFTFKSWGILIKFKFQNIYIAGFCNDYYYTEFFNYVHLRNCFILVKYHYWVNFTKLVINNKQLIISIRYKYQIHNRTTSGYFYFFQKVKKWMNSSKIWNITGYVFFIWMLDHNFVWRNYNKIIMCLISINIFYTCLHRIKSGFLSEMSIKKPNITFSIS